MFTFLVSITALLVRSSAFFSVKGIGMLFAGAMLETMIMAGSLEAGKLMCVSFLYRFWGKTPKFLRTYLLIAVITLMGITSLGIYGFLSAAYQKSASQYGIFTQQVSIYEKQKEYVQKDLKTSDDRINALNDARRLQEDSLNKASMVNAKNTEVSSSQLSQSRRIQENTMKLIKESSQELEKMQKHSDESLVKIKDLDMKIMELKETSKHNKDIITFQFIADAIGWELNRVVKWFILIIIVVFDPLAVGLVLAYNIIVCGKMTTSETKVIPSIKKTESVNLADIVKNNDYKSWEDNIVDEPAKEKECIDSIKEEIPVIIDEKVKEEIIIPVKADVTEIELKNVFIDSEKKEIQSGSIVSTTAQRKKTDQEIYQEIQSTLDTARGVVK